MEKTKRETRASLLAANERLTKVCEEQHAALVKAASESRTQEMVERRRIAELEAERSKLRERCAAYKGAARALADALLSEIDESEEY